MKCFFFFFSSKNFVYFFCVRCECSPPVDQTRDKQTQTSVGVKRQRVVIVLCVVCSEPWTRELIEHKFENIFKWSSTRGSYKQRPHNPLFSSRRSQLKNSFLEQGTERSLYTRLLKRTYTDEILCVEVNRIQKVVRLEKSGTVRVEEPWWTSESETHFLPNTQKKSPRWEEEDSIL